MPDSRQGSLEIDQTLRLARDAIELDIARYPILIQVSVVVLTSALRLTGLSDVWLPTACFAVALVNALAIRAYLTRYGNPPLLSAYAILSDLLMCVGPFVLMTRYGPPQAVVKNTPFVMYICGPALTLTVFINALRASAALSIWGGVAATAMYVLIVPWLTGGFHPGQASVSLIIALAGVIGVASARQVRKNLDSFARLQLLRRYLPPEAVDRVMRDDPDAALSLGGRQVTVTLLAADLRGFTSMSESLSPTEVMKQLNAYHGAMIDVIERHGGAIDKFIGDGTLVVFGLTGSPEAAAEAAVACGRAMLDALVVHNEERAKEGSAPLAMGIGVHTGPVIAGNLGVPGRRLEFTVIGDTVNSVSRLEGQTKGAESPLMVSADTVGLLASSSGLKELPPVSLRGKTASMRVYGLASSTLLPPSAA